VLSPADSFRLACGCFIEAVACAGVEIETIELFQVLDPAQTGLVKGTLSIKSMEDNTFEQITESHVVVFGKGLEYLQDSLFHADSRLHAFNHVFVVCHLCIDVSWY
jgi:hypothetical protein